MMRTTRSRAARFVVTCLAGAWATQGLALDEADVVRDHDIGGLKVDADAERPTATMLLSGPLEPGMFPQDPVCRMIVVLTPPETWPAAGGTGAMVEKNRDTGLWVSINAPLAVQQEIEGLLASLRVALKAGDRLEAPIAAEGYWAAGAKTAGLRERLEHKVDFAWDEKPLRDALAELAAAAKPPLVIDQQSLADKEGRLLTLQAKGEPIGDVLERVLRTQCLDYIIRGGAVVVRLRKDTSHPAIYPLHKLVGPKRGAADIVEAIEAVRPGNWDAELGDGVIRIVGPELIVVRTTAAGHRHVRHTLDGLAP